MSKRPNIAYISSEQFPSPWTDTRQIIQASNAIHTKGENVDLIIPNNWDADFFSNTERKTNSINDYYGIKTSIPIIKLSHLPRNAFRLEKFAHSFIAPFYAFIKGYDIVYSRNILVICISLLFGLKCIYENHRLIKEQKYLYVLFKFASLFKNFLGVTTNAQVVKDHYLSLGVKENQLCVAYNGFSPELAGSPLTQSQARTKLHLDPLKKIICYTGHIQKNKGIDVLIKLAHSLPDISFVICGGSAEDIENAKKHFKQFPCKNIIFKGWVDPKSLYAYLYAADILIIPPTAIPFKKYKNTVVPIKIFSYLASGNAIVAPELPDVMEVLEHKKNAILIEPDNLEQNVLAIKGLLQDSKLYNSISSQAKVDAQKYTWDARAKHVINFINTLWEKSKS